MRRILTVICILLLLAVPVELLAVLSSQISQYSDDVVITQTTIFGDSSAADGITIDLWSDYWENAYWNTRFSTDDMRNAETVFYPSNPFEDSENYIYIKYPEPGITIRDSIGCDYGDEIPPGTQNGVNDAFDALAEDILPGESRTETIRLADYMEYYALQVEITIPRDTALGYTEILATSRVIENEKAAAEWLSELEPGSSQYVAQQFQEFFRIPVLPAEKINIGLEKNSYGEIDGVSYENAESETASLYSRYHVVTEDAIYFTFQSHGTDGTPLDFSQVPGGYGIYCLPYSKADGLRADQLAMVYQLNPANEILAMELNTDQSSLLLHTLENGTYVMTVIEPDTMTVKQRIEAADFPENSYEWSSWTGDNFLAVLYTDCMLVFSVDADGTYKLDFIVSLPETSENWRWPEPEDVMIYDGQKLAAAGPLNSSKHLTDTFGLTIYSSQGINYHGTYKTGFNPADVENYRLYCNLRLENPLTVNWN